MDIIYLLPKTYPRTGIKREEYERIGGEVFVQSFVQKPIRVKFKSYFFKFSFSIAYQNVQLSVIYGIHTIRSP